MSQTEGGGNVDSSHQMGGYHNEGKSAWPVLMWFSNNESGGGGGCMS